MKLAFYFVYNHLKERIDVSFEEVLCIYKGSGASFTELTVHMVGGDG